MITNIDLPPDPDDEMIAGTTVRQLRQEVALIIQAMWPDPITYRDLIEVVFGKRASVEVINDEAWMVARACMRLAYPRRHGYSERPQITLDIRGHGPFQSARWIKENDDGQAH